MSQSLSAFAALRGVEQAALSELDAATTRVRIPAGGALFQRGDPSDALFVVVSGAFEIESRAGVPFSRRARIGAGECLGEIAIVTDQLRAVSAIALDDSEAIRVPSVACRRVMAAYPEVHNRLAALASRRRPSAQLSANPLFAGIDAAAVDALDAAAAWVGLDGGATLFTQGDAPDALFVLVRGTLHVLIDAGDGVPLSVEYLEAGALVGELGVLLDQPRSATIRAVRDCELIHLPRAAFLQFLAAEPAFGASLARLLGSRLVRTTRQPRVRPRVRTVALLPARRQLPAAFLDDFMTALAACGAAVGCLSGDVLDAALGPGASAIGSGESGDSRIIDFCDDVERDHSVVLYAADPSDSAWTRRSLRQADLILIVADAADAASPEPFEKRATDGRPSATTELVLVHGDDRTHSGTIEWLRQRSVAGHHHVRAGRRADVERLARFVVGAAVGVALSGGGARGFAHLGVLKALADAAIPVDAIGGSSMGAIVAAQYAAGFDLEAMIEMNGRSFAGSDLSDLTIPTVALRRGRSIVRRLSRMFGDRQIEDLPLRYFCVSSDLTRASVRVHDRGPLWLWTRASCAIPGLVPPIPFEGSLLVDGGLLNNLPADVMRQRCSGTVIGVNMTPTVDLATDAPPAAEMSGWPLLRQMLLPRAGDRSFPNIAQILSRTVFVSSVRDAEEQARHCDLYLQPPIDGIGMGDFAAIERIVDAGYRHAQARIAEWQTRSRRDSGAHERRAG